MSYDSIETLSEKTDQYKKDKKALDEEFEVFSTEYDILQQVDTASLDKDVQTTIENVYADFLKEREALNKRDDDLNDTKDALVKTIEEKHDELDAGRNKLEALSGKKYTEGFNKAREKVKEHIHQVEQMLMDLQDGSTVTKSGNGGSFPDSMGIKTGGQSADYLTGADIDQIGDSAINTHNNITAEEIKRHRIKFDEAGRIISYDGKSFGGKYNTYEDRLAQVLKEDNPIIGHYEGVRGESKFIPSSQTAEGIVVTEILCKYGLDGIVYLNAEPDFEPCAEAVVTIPAMTENRENYIDANGDSAIGNFVQADIELAKIWNANCRQGRNDWTPREIKEYRKANKLTWHEKCDTKTMVLVRSEINQFFKHSGGCSECKVRDKAADTNGGNNDV